MKTAKSRLLRSQFPDLLVLVPHRDARLPLRAWSGSLFAAGLAGAWSFPRVAPLAVLAREIPGRELKELARILRECRRADGGRFTAGSPAAAQLPFAPGGSPVFAFGPSLDIALPDAFSARGLEPIIPAVLGAALVRQPFPGNPPGSLPDPPRVSFRAAALAVARFRPLPAGDPGDGFSLEWEIGEPHWLPRPT